MTTASKVLANANAQARALQIVESMPAHAWSADSTGTFTYVSPNTLAFLGTTLDDLNCSPDGFGWRGIVHPDDRGDVAVRWRHCLQTGDQYDTEQRLRRADGVYVWCRTSGRTSRDSRGNVTGWCGTIFEIDDQKHVEAALRDRERELSQLVDMVPSHLWRLTPSGQPIFFNRRMVDFLGLDVADSDRPGMSRLEAVIQTVIHPNDAPEFRDTLGHCLVTGAAFAMRYRLRRADGAYRWMSSRAEPLRDQRGLIVQWYGLCHEIDDQMHAEEVLRGRERELSQLVDMVPGLLWRLTPDGEPTFFNKGTIKFLGMDVADYDKPGESRLAATIVAITHPDDAARLTQALHHSFVTGERFSMRYRLRRADGVYRWMSGRAEPIRDESGRVIEWYGLAHDIDDQVHAEEALRQTSDKLARATQAASLAQLSASIAHEVNQPLAAIVANSHACHRWLSAETPNVERAKITSERIIRDANSAAEVVSRIRALFSQSAEPMGSTMLPDVIAEVRSLMSEEAARRHIAMDIDLESNLPPIACDLVQLQQVLINLIRNGMDAADAAAGDRTLRIRVHRMGNAVQTEISDRGSGVAFPDRIFEPFFTTKGHGMGMGLAICRSIVESHGGRLWTEKNEPEGAVFIFTLPIAVKAAP